MKSRTESQTSSISSLKTASILHPRSWTKVTSSSARTKSPLSGMTESQQRNERDARRNHERANTRKSAETRRASSKASPVVANPGACSADGRDYVADGRQETTDRRQNKHANAANATRRSQRNEGCRIA